MLFSKQCLALALLAPSVAAWAPTHNYGVRKSTAVYNYLDNLSRQIIEENSPEPEDSSTPAVLDSLGASLRGESLEEREEELNRESMNLAGDKVANYGVGDWSSFVDFNEFDGGDGQMGVAGDGSKGLDKEWEGEATIHKSRARSAKNAWGTSTGYADKLVKEGVEATRAQQLENWQNQQEVRNMRNQHRYMTDQFDNSEESSPDEDWRKLSKFGVERNQDFDLDATFGEVVPGQVYHHFEMQSRAGRAEVAEFNLLNSFMGYSDFRARFTAETSGDWSVEPTEGSLNGKKGTDFTLKFKPSGPGVSTGYLVIETDEDKWTFQLTGSGSM